MRTFVIFPLRITLFLSRHVFMFVRRIDDDHLNILLIGAQVADETDLSTEGSYTVEVGDGGRG